MEVRVGETTSKKYQCAICVEEFPGKEVVKYCDEKHIFCRKCFDQWVQTWIHRDPNQHLRPPKLDEHYCFYDDKAIKRDHIANEIPELFSKCVECPICRSDIVVVKDGMENFTGSLLLNLPIRGYYSTVYKVWRMFEIDYAFTIPYPPGELPDGCKKYHKIKCSYRNGKKHGLYKVWNDKGDLLTECYFKDGRLEGTFKYQDIYSDPDRYEYSYVDGKMHGKAFKWSHNGTLLKEESYDMGVPHGESKSYTNEGFLYSYTLYDHGIPVVQKMWYSNGNLQSENIRREGSMYNELNYWMRDGIYRVWHMNGSLYEIERWYANKPYGLHQRFDEDGNLISETDFGDLEVICEDDFSDPSA